MIAAAAAAAKGVRESTKRNDSDSHHTRECIVIASVGFTKLARSEVRSGRCAYVLFLKSFLTAATQAGERASVRVGSETSSPSAFILFYESRA